MQPYPAGTRERTASHIRRSRPFEGRGTPSLDRSVSLCAARPSAGRRTTLAGGPRRPRLASRLRRTAGSGRAPGARQDSRGRRLCGPTPFARWHKSRRRARLWSLLPRPEHPGRDLARVASPKVARARRGFWGKYTRRRRPHRQGARVHAPGTARARARSRPLRQLDKDYSGSTLGPKVLWKHSPTPVLSGRFPD